MFWPDARLALTAAFALLLKVPSWLLVQGIGPAIRWSEVQELYSHMLGCFTRSHWGIEGGRLWLYARQNFTTIWRWNT